MASRIALRSSNLKALKLERQTKLGSNLGIIPTLHKMSRHIATSWTPYCTVHIVPRHPRIHLTIKFVFHGILPRIGLQLSLNKKIKHSTKICLHGMNHKILNTKKHLETLDCSSPCQAMLLMWNHELYVLNCHIFQNKDRDLQENIPDGPQ